MLSISLGIVGFLLFVIDYFDLNRPVQNAIDNLLEIVFPSQIGFLYAIGNLFPFWKEGIPVTKSATLISRCNSKKTLNTLNDIWRSEEILAIRLSAIIYTLKELMLSVVLAFLVIVSIIHYLVEEWASRLHILRDFVNLLGALILLAILIFASVSVLLGGIFFIIGFIFFSLKFVLFILKLADKPKKGLLGTIGFILALYGLWSSFA
ncbi:hypothetical protein KO528_07480 [Saccharophagus degradans]|uniref:hypothetical protein n=1 Tax=Saccharophagus degradans TaxID=86304 RepID=UPI001C091DF0|nr:hypothetical protein [Saccharophagus degradans]MBU2985187.1 hypothetical protein [Saccharophagus degradans]